MPAFYQHEPGAVVSTAINQYIYITVNKKFDRQIRASYSVTEMVNSVHELKHELVREALKMVQLDGGVENTSISDIPSRGTGLGSSNSYTVGLLNALNAYRGRHAGVERLACEACQIEIERCAKPIGKQDQYIAAYGGLQFFQFNPDGSVFVDPIICKAETRRTLQKRLLLLYTGLRRSGDQILAEQQRNTEDNSQQREMLRALTYLARELRAALARDDLDPVGEKLHQGWSLKWQLARQISNDAIVEWYQRARLHSALAGKLLGAGGGGFVIVCLPGEAC